MIIRDIIWVREFQEKIETKHGLSWEEVEYVLMHQPYFRFQERGRVKGENLYSAWGRTSAGRYIVVFIIFKKGSRALPISARLMTLREKRHYGRRKKKKG